MKKRVVITGLGVLSPIGNNIEEFYNSLKEGISGVGSITRFDVERFGTKIAGEVKNFDPADFMDKKELKRMDRYSQLAIAATKMAIEDSEIDLEKINRERMGVIIGSGVGGMETFEEQYTKFYEKGPRKISPFFIPMMIVNMAAGQVAINIGAKGPNETIVTACASATNAAGDAFKLIQRGDADIVITGGTEAPLTPMALGGFSAMKALSTRNDDPKRASRPFDKDRDGFVMAEGSGIIILEELEHALNRGAKIYGEFLGYGMTCDANHITTPAENGEGAYRSMELAIKDAGLEVSDIDYINAHGTSTEYNDKFETTAIRNLFGKYSKTVNISSTKSMTGHLLGAAGGVEACVCCLAISNSFIPPTINYENPDEECDLNYTPNTSIEKEVNYTLSNSLGFGGHNASIVIGKYKG